MEFLDTFFEDEVRDGFFVPAMVKRGWAAELEVLAEIDRVCKKHKIKYYAEWGSLLGTIRHQGFIPWDDDLDIGMLRKDYKKFIEVAEEEFDGKFTLFTYKTHKDFWHFLARVVGNTRICFEEEHLNRFHQFPYIAGVDIFVLDKVCNDEEREKYRNTLAKYVIEAADEICTDVLSVEESEKHLSTIERLCSVRIPQEMRFYLYDSGKNGSNSTLNVEISTNERKYRLRAYLYELAEKMFEQFENEDCEFVTQLMPGGLYGKGYKLEKKYYDKIIRLPFENTTMPVPAAYDEMLRRRYGDYMKIVKNRAGHDYPFFSTQQKQLDEVLKREGVEGLKEYGFDLNAIHKHDEERISNKQNSYKELVKECLKELNNIVKSIKNCFEKRYSEKIMELLADSQQLAMDLGGLIENCKGEEFVTIGYIQVYCEKVYVLYEQIGNGDYGTNALMEVEESLIEVEKSINNDVLWRQEIVFVVCQFKYWKSLANIWKYYSDNPIYDVRVIVVPYYYKKYDGSFYEMKYELELFANKFDVIKYDEYDFGLMYPEKIFIQNPYDAFNPVISIHTFFYSENLKKFTDELIYIPSFKLDDFDKTYFCEYENMKYYCTVPGVVNSDIIILESDKMKQVYIDKLVDFAGEDTRNMWHEKIKVYDMVFENIDYDDGICDDTSAKMSGSDKKTILYYTGVSGWIQYGTEMLRKIKYALNIFENNRKKIRLIWKSHPMTEQIIKECCAEAYDDYINLVSEFIESKIGVFSVYEEDEKLVEECDAYYGDSEAIVRRFQRARKPVMIQNIEILEGK